MINEFHLSDAPHFVVTRLFGVTTTLVFYMFALAVHHRIRWIHPLLFTCILLIALLVLLPYTASTLTITDYQLGGRLITFFLGPATVALAVPLYRHRNTLARHAVQIAASIVVFTGNIYAGLWYPIGIAGLSLVIGLILLPETKDRSLQA